MKRFIKQSNFLIFFVVVLILLLSGSYKSISTSLLSTLPNNQNKELLKKFENNSNNKILFVSTKGFDKKSLQTIQQLEKEILNIANINEYDKTTNKKLTQHQQEYQFFLKKLDYEKLQKLDIKENLNNLYQSLTTSFIPIVIDKSDPLSLLKKEKNVSIKFMNGHTIIKDYGYISYFTLQSKNLEEHTIVYDAIKNLTQENSNIQLFSPIFYYVENSSAIKQDINKILIIALIVLLSLYVIILKNISLFVNTITTLATSSMVAIFTVTQIYEEVSIFVVAFGISISSIAVDYMFHHYMHQHYHKQKRVNKEVLYGFMTTILSFVILSFISFTLIQQISIFALISLLVSYLHFAFLYPQIQFKTKKSLQFNLPTFHIKPYIIFSSSIIAIIISIGYMKFDLNIKNLDYDNQTLKKQELFFKKSLNEEQQIPILISAKNINQLVLYAKKIKELSPTSYIPFSNLLDSKSFKTINQERFTHLNHAILKLSKEVGFREGYFKNAYNISVLKEPIYSLEKLQMFGLPIFKHQEQFHTFFSINAKDYSSVLSLSFVKSLSIKNLFEKSVKNIFDELLTLGTVILIAIFIILFLVTKKRLIYALNFLLFPLAVMTLYSYFVPFNILHIFMLFIILAIGIDYAFYTSKQTSTHTKKAIVYSLLSTFAGFGVLSFSSIYALNSIGIIATLGIIAILLLLIFSKRFTDET